MAETIDEILARLRGGIERPEASVIEKEPSEPARQIDGGANAPVTDDAKPEQNVMQLSPEQITSAVYVIAPSQVDYIARIFADAVANAMNMRAFAPKIRAIATQSLHRGLGAAKKMGKK